MSERSALNFVFAGADRPQGHAIQEPVTNYQCVEEHRAEVGEERREQQIREDRVRLAQDRVEHRIGRKNRRQMHWPEHHDGIVSGGQHAPTHERHGEHQAVEQLLG